MKKSFKKYDRWARTDGCSTTAWDNCIAIEVSAVLAVSASTIDSDCKKFNVHMISIFYLKKLI